MGTVNYDLRGEIALVTLDDGKANALSAAVISDVHACLDRAAADQARALVLTGRPGTFSGGFDLAVMKGGDLAAIAGLVTDGGELLLRFYQSALPIVCAASGHAIRSRRDYGPRLGLRELGISDRRRPATPGRAG